MPGSQAVVWRDDHYLATGTQKGSGTTITDRGKDFKSCGVRPGLAVKNCSTASLGVLMTETLQDILTEDGQQIITQLAQGVVYGHVVSVTEDTVVTDIPFYVNNVYEIFKTATYNSKISTHHEDRRAGHKITDPSQTYHGVLIEDVDLDENNKNAWGPSQPWRD